MKIALCSSFVPFVDGGYRNIVDWLADVLVAEGHDVEKVWLPEVDTPAALVPQMAAYRWIDLEAADRVICFRPQSHLIRHRHKIVWFIHHLRVFYDMWDTPYRGFPDDVEHRALRDVLHTSDTRALHEARAIFANSHVVAGRLSRFNGIDAEVLYPPVVRPERFRSGHHGDTVVSVCRMESHKRQHLLVEAMKHTKTPVKLALYGASGAPDYVASLRDIVATHGLQGRVMIDNRWVSEVEKIDVLESALAIAYVPHDEDSYGYPVVEGAHAGRPAVTTHDSGGVLEFVRDGVEGAVTDANPVAIARAFDALFEDRSRTAGLGRAAAARIDELGISWRHVLERLLA